MAETSVRNRPARARVTTSEVNVVPAGQTQSTGGGVTNSIKRHPYASSAVAALGVAGIYLLYKHFSSSSSTTTPATSNTTSGFPLNTGGGTDNSGSGTGFPWGAGGFGDGGSGGGSSGGGSGGGGTTNPSIGPITLPPITIDFLNPQAPPGSKTPPAKNAPKPGPISQPATNAAQGGLRLVPVTPATKGPGGFGQPIAGGGGITGLGQGQARIQPSPAKSVAATPGTGGPMVYTEPTALNQPAPAQKNIAAEQHTAASIRAQQTAQTAGSSRGTMTNRKTAVKAPPAAGHTGIRKA